MRNGALEELERADFNGHSLAVATHAAGSKNLVIFCHGYRGTSVGPSRFFVRAARQLAEQGISSLRFDQYGSGNSEGDFYDSSFSDWLATTKAIAQEYLNQGHKIVLLGHSMGGATAIAVGSELPEVTAVVAWAPSPGLGGLAQPANDYVELAGQRVRVQAAYWQEARAAKVADKLSLLKAPALILHCAADEYVDEASRKAISDNAQPHHQVVNLEGYSHGNWTYDQAEEIVRRSVDFIKQALSGQA
jgi:alpha-beta hydrolase superfamily lysophospholipase